MKIAYVWYNSTEHSIVVAQIKQQKPGWELVRIPEETICNLNAVLNLLRSGYDALLIHLSLRFCLALKMAEVIHRENVRTKVILFSRTVSDQAAIFGFFDGHIHPDRDIFNLAPRIEDIVRSQRLVITDEKEINQRILRIFNSSGTLKASYVKEFGLRHKHDFTLEDYHNAIAASSKLDQVNSPAMKRDVFISYSTVDRALAKELADLLSREGVISFMAERDLESGDKWGEEIREALAAATEVILVLTPNSFASKWVMIEAGGAWILRKIVTPCTAFVDVGALPEPISQNQARSIETEEGKRRVVAEIKARMAKRLL